MEYALYHRIRTRAQPTLKGYCSHCHSEVMAKCGSKKIWHWAHKSSVSCDTWFESETQWHRDWKNHFGEEFSEIRISKENVYHIADVMNEAGIIFEFQNSPISSETIKAREEFYGERMIWIMNGASFKNKFKIEEEEYLSYWKLKILDEFSQAAHYKNLGRALLIEDWWVKRNEVRSLLKQEGFIYSEKFKLFYLPLTIGKKRDLCIDRLYVQIQSLYFQHRVDKKFTKACFEWEHPRSSWEESKREVFIDFGVGTLFRFTKNVGKKRGEGILICKNEFLKKYTSAARVNF